MKLFLAIALALSVSACSIYTGDDDGTPTADVDAGTAAPDASDNCVAYAYLACQAIERCSATHVPVGCQDDYVASCSESTARVTLSDCQQRLDALTCPIDSSGVDYACPGWSAPTAP